MKTPEQVRREMRKTPEGKLLWEYGYDMYDTESPARTVARLAAKDLAELKRCLDAIAEAEKMLCEQENALRLLGADEPNAESTILTLRSILANASRQGRREGKI
jgi:hypothetical protein